MHLLNQAANWPQWFDDVHRSTIGRVCRASSSGAPAKLSGLKTRRHGFKQVLHRRVEIATQSGRSNALRAINSKLLYLEYISGTPIYEF
jgi:hypothetical protein